MQKQQKKKKMKEKKHHILVKRRPSYKQCSEPSKKYACEMKSKFDVEYEIQMIMMQKKDQNIGDWIQHIIL